MSGLEREAFAAPGPRFEKDGEQVLFTFVIDSGSRIGPRPASEADKIKHVGAWMEFQRLEGLSVLDHDGDGRPGGSLPTTPASAQLPAFQKPEEPNHERDTLRKDLAMLGVEIDNRWGVPRLRRELDKATQPPKAD